MGFETLTTPESDSMYAGQIISYYIRPLMGIRVFWMTEITHVAEGRYFVDEQRFGPYAFWHHTHFFKRVTGGVLMTERSRTPPVLGSSGLASTSASASRVTPAPVTGAGPAAGSIR